MDASATNARAMFHGSPTSDVKKFFFFYENVAMRGKSGEEKAMELLSHLEDAAFDFYYETFAYGDDLKEEARLYVEVKKAIVDRFFSPPSPEDFIRKTVSASLNPEDLIGSLRYMDNTFEKAKFNDEAKFGILRNSLREIPQLAQFAIYRGANDYKSLKKVVHDFVNGQMVFFAHYASEPIKERPPVGPVDEVDSVYGSKRVITRSDARGSQIEQKVDKLTEQLEKLLIFSQKEDGIKVRWKRTRS